MNGLDATRLHVFSDFDGTVSEPDTLKFLTERFGAGAAHYRETGRLLRAGEISLRDGVARDIGTLTVPFADAARALRAHVSIDPGFPPFARWCASERIPLTILSAGFEEIIALFLGREDFPDLEVRANRFRPGSWECIFRDASPLGHDKAAAVVQARRRGRKTIFIGDGFSDREAAAVADVVFVRRERSLVEHCRAAGIACEEYATFHDVHKRLPAALRRAA